VYSSRITILVGHFGSGKTEIAINGAQALARAGRRVVLVDLDVVKPYFRSRSARAVLAAQGIEVVAPQGENVFADLPIIVPTIRAAVRDPARTVLVDAGGDPTGARALGSLADAIPEEGVDTLAVVNFRRPFTTTAADAVTMVRAIEAAARRRVTGLVSNTHLLGETTAEVVLHGYGLACQAGEELGVPVRAVVVDEALEGELAGARLGAELTVLKRVVRPPFELSRRQRTTGPLFVVH
jgi:hypothetical protein